MSTFSYRNENWFRDLHDASYRFSPKLTDCIDWEVEMADLRSPVVAAA